MLYVQHVIPFLLIYFLTRCKSERLILTKNILLYIVGNYKCFCIFDVRYPIQELINKFIMYGKILIDVDRSNQPVLRITRKRDVSVDGNEDLRDKMLELFMTDTIIKNHGLLSVNNSDNSFADVDIIKPASLGEVLRACRGLLEDSGYNEAASVIEGVMKSILVEQTV